MKNFVVKKSEEKSEEKKVKKKKVKKKVRKKMTSEEKTMENSDEVMGKVRGKVRKVMGNSEKIAPLSSISCESAFEPTRPCSSAAKPTIIKE